MVFKPDLTLTGVQPVFLRGSQQVLPAPGQVVLGGFSLHPVRRLVPGDPGLQIRAQLNKIEFAAALLKQILQGIQVVPFLLLVKSTDVGKNQVHIMFHGQFEGLFPEGVVELLLGRRGETEDPVGHLDAVVVHHHVVTQFVPQAFRHGHLSYRLRPADDD